MILCIENYYGDIIGAINIRENSNRGEIEIKEVTGNISIADIDFDNIFNTNEKKIRIQLEKSD